MTDDVSAEVIKKTQETLGKFIKKPPLTEKLLKKPPFRFLHDIVTNVIHDTGFFKGLYNENEMLSENIKDRDAKIAFLEKLINALKTITGAKISARPSKIIAGLEPTKTNQLLQTIGNALEKKMDSSEAVSQVTGVKTSPKEAKKPAKPKKDEKERKLVRGQTQDRISVTKKKPSPKTEKENRKNSSSSSVTNEPVKKLSKTRQESKEVESPKEVEVKEKNREEKPKNDPVPQEPQEPQEDKREHQKPPQVEPEVKEVEIKITPRFTEEKPPDTVEIIQKEPKKVEPSEMTSKPPVDIPKPLVEPPKSSQPEMITKKEIYTKRPPSSLRPPSVRPSSARPGAPRLKDRNDTILPPDQLVPLGKVKVIVESIDKIDDEEETVVMETPTETSTWPTTEIVPEDLPAEKGHLVSQILEQIGETPITAVTKPKIEWEQKLSDSGSEKLRQSIQTLTKAANPLGKLVNFLHEDVESMQGELKMWMDINEKLKTEIKVKKKHNEESMRPLQEQLARLEADIAKQNELISTTQANILRNQQKIKSLLTRD